ncbi:MAG: PEP-CTERM sorting domain-containing protein [Acidobacteria bacterium]|nr:PEP-CTERM sorting domain-containing protein [Acidobacteriota bacterium]
MKSTILGTLLLLGLGTSGAWASPLCTDQTAGGVGGSTLNYYVALGSGGCVMNGLLFGNFSYSYSISGGGTGANQAASVVLVSPNSSTDSFTFGASWVVNHTQTASLTMSFTVSAPGGSVNSLYNSFTGSGGGTLNGGPTYTPGANCIGGTCAPGPTGTVFTNNSTTIAGTSGPLLITNTIQMSANGAVSGTNSYHVSAIFDQFGATSVPEPATYGMFGLGLAGLAFLRRRK